MLTTAEQIEVLSFGLEISKAKAKRLINDGQWLVRDEEIALTDISKEIFNNLHTLEYDFIIAYSDSIARKSSDEWERVTHFKEQANQWIFDNVDSWRDLVIDLLLYDQRFGHHLKDVGRLVPVIYFKGGKRIDQICIEQK